ncbi:MAG: ABC transporter substrate-binding protein, partial [Lachnospiraceae bacterium]
MKRRLALLVVVSLLATVVMACGSSKDSGMETKESQTSDMAERTEISFWHYMTEDQDGKVLNDAIDEFNKMQDEIYVVAQYLPRDELMKQYTIGVVSGELPDIAMVDNPDHSSYASIGVFEDITELYEDWDEGNFMEGSLKSCYYEDKLYGIPWGNNCLGLFYNKQMLDAAGVDVPTTWSELEAASEKLTNKDVKGLAISAIGNEEGTFQYMPWLLSSGGSVDKLDSEGSKASMAFLYNLIEKGY